jgi:hypothetical protein
MARKKVWLSWLSASADGERIQGLTAALGKAGLAVDGAVWNRDLARVGWLDTAERLADCGSADLWLIVGDLADFQDRTVRYGLSLAQAAVQSRRAQPLPTVAAGLDQAPPPSLLPAMLRQAQCLAPPATHWGAQLVAIAMRRPRVTDPQPLRLNVLAHPSLGQWFEIGPPAGDAWQGAIFGIDDGEITHQGVGPSGTLPECCTLEYPSQGIRAQAGGRAFTCWAVRNALDSGQSHYVRVVGTPSCLLFGELPEGDDAELCVLELF